MLYEHPGPEATGPAWNTGFWTEQRSNDAAEPTGDPDLFLAQLDDTLRRLRASRLRFSIMRLVLPADRFGDPVAARRVAARMADPHVIVGLWRDGSVAAAFFGPRAGGSTGDGEQMRRIVQRCRKAVADAGETELLSRARLLIGHCWTDEAGDLSSLIEALGATGD